MMTTVGRMTRTTELLPSWQQLQVSYVQLPRPPFEGAVMMTATELSNKTCNHSLNTLYLLLRRRNLQTNSATHKRNPWFFYARNTANSHLAPQDPLCREGGSHKIPFVGKTARRSVRRFRTSWRPLLGNFEKTNRSSS